MAFSYRSLVERTLAVMIGVVAVSNAALAAPTAARSERPNILFILADNLGYGEIGAYGGGETRGAPTPRIDSMANEGLRLTNMNMETQCTPSRSSLMTGRCQPASNFDQQPASKIDQGFRDYWRFLNR